MVVFIVELNCFDWLIALNERDIRQIMQLLPNLGANVTKAHSNNDTDSDETVFDDLPNRADSFIRLLSPDARSSRCQTCPLGGFNVVKGSESIRQRQRDKDCYFARGSLYQPRHDDASTFRRSGA